MQDVASIVRDELLHPVPEPVTGLAHALRQRFGTACAAVLFYGSCLRLGDAMLTQSDGILDFYVLVDDYKRAYPERRLLAAANGLLPPNVFFAEHEVGDRRMRAKYAVITVDQFARSCELAGATSAVWARFSQPARLVYWADERVRSRVVGACVSAVESFVSAAIALQGETFRTDALWITGFRYTYEAELRSEKGDDRALAIVAADPDRYRQLGASALAARGASCTDGLYRNPLAPEERRAGQARWRRWRRNGKVLNLLRLIKAVFTFEGAVDYALWKIERHAGIRPPVSDWERRHPILAAPVLLWRFHRAGAFR
jgi:hypothetical protein